MTFDSFELFSADRSLLLDWLEKTASPTLQAPRESPVQGSCWRIRRPLEMRGRRYGVGCLLVLGETQIAIEIGGEVGNGS